MRAHQTARLRRVMVVAELSDGAGLIIDTSQHAPTGPLMVRLEAEDVTIYWDEPWPQPVYTLTIEGLGGFFYVADVAQWFADHTAPAPEQETLPPPEQPAIEQSPIALPPGGSTA